MRAQLHLDAPHLWDGVKDPYLYTCVVRLSSDGTVVDEVSTRVGLRTFSVDSRKGFFLKGRPYPLQGDVYKRQALEHLNRYRGLHRNLDTAIDYLTAYHVAHDLYDLPLGRTEVDGENVFINVMEADLSPDSTRLEYHKKYADLQIDLTGGEATKAMIINLIIFPIHKPRFS